jgi:hypothetical protein
VLRDSTRRTILSASDSQTRRRSTNSSGRRRASRATPPHQRPLLIGHQIGSGAHIGTHPCTSTHIPAPGRVRVQRSHPALRSRFGTWSARWSTSLHMREVAGSKPAAPIDLASASRPNTEASGQPSVPNSHRTFAPPESRATNAFVSRTSRNGELARPSMLTDSYLLGMTARAGRGRSLYQRPNVSEVGPPDRR